MAKKKKPAAPQKAAAKNTEPEQAPTKTVAQLYRDVDRAAREEAKRLFGKVGPKAKLTGEPAIKKALGLCIGHLMRLTEADAQAVLARLKKAYADEQTRLTLRAKVRPLY